MKTSYTTAQDLILEILLDTQDELKKAQLANKTMSRNLQFLIGILEESSDCMSALLRTLESSGFASSGLKSQLERNDELLKFIRGGGDDING